MHPQTVRISFFTLFEIFIFCPQIRLWFPEKIVKKIWVKTSWKCCGCGLFSCWQLWFHEKNCQKKIGWKTRENVGVLSKLNFWTKNEDFEQCVTLTYLLVIPREGVELLIFQWFLICLKCNVKNAIMFTLPFYEEFKECRIQWLNLTLKNVLRNQIFDWFVL